MIKRVLAILLLGVSSVFAQTIQTTPNLITSGTTHTWYGVTTGTIPSNYMPGGPQPRYDPNTNTIAFSYSSASVGQTYAVNQALASVGAGVKVNGYSYSYEVRNMNGDDRQGGIDTFTVSQLLRGPQNSVLLSSSQYYNTKFDWQTVSGTRNATTPYNIADTSYIQFGISGADNGYWAGFFGPQIRNVSMSLRYSVDPCATNPAYSPTCANYNTVSISDNLLPGLTGPQAYAINNALAAAGAGATIHGFNYGYNYQTAGRSCAFWDLFGACITGWNYSSAGVDTEITNSAGTTIYTESNTHGGGSGGTSGTFTKEYRFSSSVPMSTLGTFSMTPWTSGNASITNMYSRGVYTADPCLDPLSSPSCPGYAAAYMTQQCTANPLYNSACPGYAQAYFNQQCSASALYDSSCPGYASAYLTYQCSINPLYSTTCSGYQQAYHDQQCSISPLYASDCNGYQQAYHNQQCSANPLYASDCVGYAEAYFNQQCTADPLYNSQCSGYKTAYALKYITPTTATTPTTTTPVAETVVEATKAVSDPVSTATAAPSTTSATSISPVAVISTVKPAPAATETVAQAEPKKDEKKAEDTPKASSDTKSDSPKPKTAREEMAAKREEAAKKEAVAKAKNLADEMGQAASLEAQKAVQNVVIQAMGYSPGFDQYGKTMIPDTQFYRPFAIYGGQKNIDTRSGARLFGGSDRVHQEMVDSQYQLGK